MTRCLYCYLPIPDEELTTDAGLQGYHRTCSTKFFGRPDPPRIDFSEEDLLELGYQVIKSQRSVTGVQPKLSLDIDKEKDLPPRFTIVGLWGQYILKPPSEAYPFLPENEDLTMHLAELSGIRTVEHALIRLKSPRLAYITRRVDRQKEVKFHMEDMCQLTGRLTEHKYKGSHEQIAKAIRKFSANPGLDVVNFFELVLFCFLTGNTDMHLKNFSLLKTKGEYNLSPAYDLVATQLALKDEEELALTLNGKKKNLSSGDFQTAMMQAGLDEKVIENVFKKLIGCVPLWDDIIDQSFLPAEMKARYRELIKSRLKQIQ